MPTNTLAAIRDKVRRITGRPSIVQISDAQIDEYVNTFYVYDFPEQLRLESLRTTYEFITNANQPVYDFPRDLYLTAMPPVYIGGYQSFMTQSRENFFRVNPQLNYIQSSVATGNNTTGPYNFTLTYTPIIRGFKPNPPGAMSNSNLSDIEARYIHGNVLISGLDANGQSICLIDDGGGTDPTGLGLLFDPGGSTPTLTGDPSTRLANARGTINYLTGVVAINALGFRTAIANGAAINAQYIPYVASRPQSCVFYQDQIILYPIPDQAYKVSFEAYRYPTDLLNAADSPQLAEWWQLLAYGAADKIFADNGDIENMMKYRPLLEEQMKLVNRRTIQQYTSERTATIYTEQTQYPQYPFSNMFSGI